MYTLSKRQIENWLKLHKLEDEKPKEIEKGRSWNMYKFRNFVIVQGREEIKRGCWFKLKTLK